MHRRDLGFIFLMSTKKLTHIEFINRLKLNFPNKNYKIIDEYNGAHNHIQIITKYGICKVKPSSLLQGNFPSIRTALNQTEYFIKQYKEKYNKYDLSKFEFKNAHSKSDVYCLKHGLFEITPNNLLTGYGCIKCASEKTGNQLRMTKEDFIRKAKLIHGSKYNYSNVKFKNNKDKINIICKKHGFFKQTVSDHLSNNGCKICGNIRISKARRIIPLELAHSVSKIRGCISTSFRRKGFKKTSKVFEILGIEWKEFVKYLENNKYGFKITDENIDLDHIIPIATATTKEDIIKLNHYSNFQLLPSDYNKWVKRHNEFNILHFENWLIEKYGEFANLNIIDNNSK